jgi:hypothetical protein
VRSQTIANCSDQAVVYGTTPKEIGEKIEVLKVSLPAGAPTSSRRVASPQGTAWFDEVDPDYMSTKVPWTTTLYVGGVGHSGVFLQVSFKDHGNTFYARWLNEKLVFIQVGWGRIVSSDIILDVSRGQFIYNEFAHYGQLIEPCK